MRRTRAPLLAVYLILVWCPWGEATSAAPQAESQDAVEFRLWAQYQNVLHNAEVLKSAQAPKPPKSVDQFLDEARRNYGFTPEQVRALTEKGEALEWEGSPECALPAAPVGAGGLVSPPFRQTPLSAPPPTSPPEPVKMVIFEVVISSDGELVQQKILQRIEGRDAEAFATLQTWQWSPALLCGKPVDGYLAVSVPVHVDSTDFTNR